MDINTLNGILQNSGGKPASFPASSSSSKLNKLSPPDVACPPTPPAFSSSSC